MTRNPGRLIIVSNRLPITASRKDGRIEFQGSSGGRANGMGSFYRKHNSLWVGWPGLVLKKPKEEKKVIEEYLNSHSCYPVYLSQYDVENYYYGFANRTLWPLFHYFTESTEFNSAQWEAYKKANRQFYETLLNVVKPNDTVWVHDYHLMLLPKMLRDRFPDLTIGFFLHIPFPSSEIFGLLPWRREILEGLLGADLIGFHTYDHLRHFLVSVHRILGYDYALGYIYAGDRMVRADTFPISIDFNRYAEAHNIPEVQKEIRKIRRRVGSNKVILSIDRLDYTKNIPMRLKAFDQFLTRYPSYREKVTMIVVAVPSRTKVSRYAALKREVDELVGYVNSKHGTIGWMPIWYLYRSLPFNTLAALYNVADVALVTPLRDGMNLIAKEYVASRVDGTGVLILSEMAGAAKELSEAIIVSPTNLEELVEAIRIALTMPPEEQIKRNETMRERIRIYDVHRWANDFVNSLLKVKETQERNTAVKLDEKVMKEIKQRYKAAKTRLIILDYEGTLIEYKVRPTEAYPDDEVLEILESLAEDERNKVVLFSGRDKDTIDEWFKDLRVHIYAENGLWYRSPDGNWNLIEPVKPTWKDEIRAILKLYMDRTPGSFIEEKELSLEWHYGQADKRIAQRRARELKHHLAYVAANVGIDVIEGKNVIEVRSSWIDKRRAVTGELNGKWDCVVAVGDDKTDEPLFEMLENEGLTIRVGSKLTKAKYWVDSPATIRYVLRSCLLEATK